MELGQLAADVAPVTYLRPHASFCPGLEPQAQKGSSRGPSVLAFVSMSLRLWLTGLALSLALFPGQASGQEPLAAPPDAPAISEADLARVRQGLAIQDPVLLSDRIPRFHIDADSGLPPTEYVQVSNSPFAGGGGLDVVGLLRKAITNWQAARREQQTREARAQVQRELHALLGGAPGPPEGFLFLPSPPPEPQKR